MIYMPVPILLGNGNVTIFDRAKQRGLICFSSPFDETSVDFLESLHVPAYKIASFENNHVLI